MQLLLTADTTALSYWLNWRVLICAIWVFPAMFIASFMIWKYEPGRQQERLWVMHDDEAWKPCLKEVHPIWLLAFRIIAFCLLVVALSYDTVAHGGELYYYYTQWTFTLVTIYFGFASLLSIHGSYKNHTMSSCCNNLVAVDEEQGLYEHLTCRENGNGAKSVQEVYYPGKHSDSDSSSFWIYLFQILFQTTAGAVMLTDIIYWCVIFPFLTIKDYDMNFLTVIAHSLNAVLLLGDTALNSLRFPWFRICYFVLWTGSYVIFQWILHACISIWWPYPFLELSSNYAPLWYFLVALLHIPCYGIFALIVHAKYYLLSRYNGTTA